MRRQLMSFATLTQRHQATLRWSGVILFIATLVTGLVWLSGREVEPLAFVLSLLSTVAFAASSFDRWVLTPETPLRDRSYREILEFVQATQRDEWLELSPEMWISERFYEPDPHLRFRIEFEGVGVLTHDFDEPWVRNFPNQNASAYWCQLTYAGQLLEKTLLVSVDGGRALIPVPDLSTGSISPFDYQVAMIFDRYENVATYVRSAGLHVSDDTRIRLPAD